MMPSRPIRPYPQRPDQALKDRITELGKKATQLLTFLSFAMVVAMTFAGDARLDAGAQRVLHQALWYWTVAAGIVVVGVVPLKEVRWEHAGWYRAVRQLKVGILWVAAFLIGCGLWQFHKAL
jgi:hypothetical protein